jgi:hypothetical protein
MNDEEKPDLVETFKALGEASQGRWEDIDAAAYVDDLRYGAGPPSWTCPKCSRPNWGYYVRCPDCKENRP